MKSMSLTVDAIPTDGPDSFLSFFRKCFLIYRPVLQPWISLHHFVREFLGNNVGILTNQQEGHLFFTALSGQEDRTAVPCDFFSFLRPVIQTRYELRPCHQCGMIQGSFIVFHSIDFGLTFAIAPNHHIHLKGLSLMDET